MLVACCWACPAGNTPGLDSHQAKPVATAVDASPSPDPGPSVDNPGEIFIYPEALVIYDRYLEVIGGRPGRADSGLIEATVLSIQRGQVCPYPDEVCRIEPYPSDWAVVRVDRIIDYAAFGTPDPAALDDRSDSAITTGEQTSEFRGPDSQPAEKERPPLRELQEVQTLFLLTTRPVKVRYVPLAHLKPDDVAAAPPLAEDGLAQDTASQRLQAEGTIFQPIPTEGDVYVFTTKVGDFPAAVEHALPGLEVGSRLRAEVRYDGLLYVEEYELIP